MGRDGLLLVEAPEGRAALEVLKGSPDNPREVPGGLFAPGSLRRRARSRGYFLVDVRWAVDESRIDFRRATLCGQFVDGARVRVGYPGVEPEVDSRADARSPERGAGRHLALHSD